MAEEAYRRPPKRRCGEQPEGYDSWTQLLAELTSYGLEGGTDLFRICQRPFEVWALGECQASARVLCVREGHLGCG